MAGSFSGNTGVHNINSNIIVFINWSSRLLGKPNFPKHIPQEPSSLGRSYSMNNLWFYGTQHVDLLCFRPIKNCTPLKFKIKLSSGYPDGRLISVCSVHKKHHFSIIKVMIGSGNIFISYNRIAFGFWDIHSGSSSFVYNPPVSGNTDIYSKVLQETVVMIRSSGREFR